MFLLPERLESGRNFLQTLQCKVLKWLMSTSVSIPRKFHALPSVGSNGRSIDYATTLEPDCEYKQSICPNPQCTAWYMLVLSKLLAVLIQIFKQVVMQSTIVFTTVWLPHLRHSTLYG